MQTFFASKTWFLSEPGHTCLWFCLFGNVLVFPTEDAELKAPAVVAHLPPIWLPVTDLRMLPAGSLCWIVTLPVWSIPTQSNFPMSFFPSGLTSPIVLSPRWPHPVDEDRFPFRFNRSLCILPDMSWVVFCFPVFFHLRSVLCYCVWLGFCGLQVTLLTTCLCLPCVLWPSTRWTLASYPRSRGEMTSCFRRHFARDWVIRSRRSSAWHTAKWSGRANRSRD